MESLPNQLRNDSFRFCKIRAKNKAPYEKAWTQNGYTHDSEELQKHLQAGGNYGVIGGYGNLRMLDIDDEALADELGEQINTFQVRTGSGGRHLYFISTYETNHVLKDDLGEFRAHNYQCVGPGSTHPNGKQYVVHKDVTIKELTEQEVSELLAPYLREETTNVTNVTTALELSDQEIITKCERAKNKHKFNALYAGSTTGYSSHSEADMALCMMFAFYTQEHAQIDRLFRSSGLYREKWEREDYRERTISSAIKQTKTTWKESDSDPVLFLAQNKRREATETLAQEFLRNNHTYTIRDDEKPEVWIYHEGIYVPNGKTKIQESVREALSEAYTSQLCNEVISKIMADTYIEAEEFFNQQDKHKTLQPVKNGLLNIQTRTLHEFTPTKRFFNKLPVTYNPEATCPQIEWFLNDIMGNDNDVRVYQEWIGFCLLREYKYEKSLFLMGKGRNGKGKAITLIEKLLGKENISNVSLQSLEKDQYSTSELLHKLLNVCGDISNKAITDSSTFKGLTGRDTQQAARKFKTRIQFENYAKMMFSANELPSTKDLTDAFFGRILAIEFPNTYLPQKEIDALLPEERTTHIKLRKQDIIEEIMSETELSGFLNFALDGLDRLTRQNGFSQSLTINKIKTMWLQKSDSFRAFCMDHVRQSFDNHITKKGLREVYALYCRVHCLRQQGNKHIKAVLEEDFGVGEVRPGAGDVCWDGISLFKIDLIYKSNKGIKENKGVPILLRNRNSKESSKTPDTRDTLDSKEGPMPLCKHGNYEDEGCLFCKKEQAAQEESR